MTDRVFLDTNILVYAIDCAPNNVPKRDRARGLIHEHMDVETGVISIQVLQEFYVASTKRIRVPLSPLLPIDNRILRYP